MKAIITACILLSAFAIGCSGSGAGTEVDTETARIYGMPPFAPSGGYKLGSIIVLKNGLPELSTGVEWLERHGKYKPLSDPDSLPARYFEQSNLFRADLQAALNRDDISASTENELNRVRSFGIEITKATRSYLAEGRAGLISWLYELDLQNEDDFRTLRVIYDTHEGQQKYLISEVIEVSQATYTAEWDRELSAGAKAGFMDLFGGQGNLEWTSEGKALVKITPGTPILVAYKRYELPMERIKNALEMRSWN
ncbi:MAG TPA: hypothetical protein VKP65_09765 [Rhodothermales bacterium]|nr:hypothetical protein [Rhodothermales bacterium]